MIDIEYGLELIEFTAKVAGEEDLGDLFDHYKHPEDAYKLFKALSEGCGFNFKHLEVGGWIVTDNEGEYVSILPFNSLEDAMTAVTAKMFKEANYACNA